MCVLAIAWQAHPRWRLVVAANRDEFHDRPAEPLHAWPGTGLLAGRDARAGGTWLAVSPAGRFAALTNLRGFGGPDPALLSRGELVADLAHGRDPADLAAFNPFNAVVIAGDGARFLSNRPASVDAPLAPGLHAMSNGPLDPPWRKSVRLTAVIERWLTAPDDDLEPLFDGLRDPAPPAGAADDPTAIFIDDPVYGTRCSTVVAIDHAGAGVVAERRFDPSGRRTGDTVGRFAWG